MAVQNTVALEIVYKLESEYFSDERINIAHMALFGDFQFTVLHSTNGTDWVEHKSFADYKSARNAAIELTQTQWLDVKVVASVVTFKLSQVSFKSASK